MGRASPGLPPPSFWHGGSQLQVQASSRRSRRSRLFCGFSMRMVLSVRMPLLNLALATRLGARKACPSSCACGDPKRR